MAFKKLLDIPQRYRKVLKYAAQILIVGIIFFFLGKSVYQNWAEVSKYKWRINYVWLTASLFLLVGDFFLWAGGWNLLLKRLGEPLSFKKSFKVYFVSQLGKYIPGSVWLVLGKVYLCGKEGISRLKASASIALEITLIVISGLLLFLVSLPFWSAAHLVVRKISLFFLIIPVGLVILHPSVFHRLLNFALVKLDKRPVNLDFRYRDNLLLVGLYLIFWFFHGSAFFLFVNSVYSVPLTRFPVFIGIFAIAWVIGFVSVFAPGGLGVREGVLTLLLSFYMPLPLAVIVSLLSRIWLTLGELICLGISMGF